MKVALCFFGQPRVINNPYTFDSHVQWIINKYDTDVFAHTWISGNATLFNYSDWVNSEYHDFEDVNTANIILNKYNPKKYKFEKPKQFQLNNDCRNKVQQLTYYSTNNEYNTLSHLYSMSTSIALIDDSYDWVILSRYDNYIKFMPDLSELNSNALYITNDYGNHFPDHMIFGGQRQLDTLNCFNLVPDLCNNVSMFIPEQFKQEAFNSLNESYHRINLKVGIARTLTLDNLQI
jgi:hypothetical protein